jgi:hypothetical protein
MATVHPSALVLHPGIWSDRPFRHGKGFLTSLSVDAIMYRARRTTSSYKLSNHIIINPSNSGLGFQVTP